VSLPQTVEVSINGRKFRIKTDKDVEYVKNLAKKIESMVEKIKAGNNRVTFEKALVVTCFYLIDENETLKEQIIELGEEIKRLEKGVKILTANRKALP